MNCFYLIIITINLIAAERVPGRLSELLVQQNLNERILDHGNIEGIKSDQRRSVKSYRTWLRPKGGYGRSKGASDDLDISVDYERPPIVS